MVDVLYVYCFKSVGSYKHKLSRIDRILSDSLSGNKLQLRTFEENGMYWTDQLIAMFTDSSLRTYEDHL